MNGLLCIMIICMCIALATLGHAGLAAILTMVTALILLISETKDEDDDWREY